MTSLDIGCGKAKKGDVGMDGWPGPGVDVVHDLRQMPWPFHDGQFDEVIASHVLEHVPWSPEPQYDEVMFRIFAEVHRILKPGGVFRVMVPHQESVRALCLPTHRRTFNEVTFTFFARDLYKVATGIEPGYRPMFERSEIRITREFGNALTYNDWHVEHHLPRLYRVLCWLRVGRKRECLVRLWKSSAYEGPVEVSHALPPTPS